MMERVYLFLCRYFLGRRSHIKEYKLLDKPRNEDILGNLHNFSVLVKGQNKLNVPGSIRDVGDLSLLPFLQTKR